MGYLASKYNRNRKIIWMFIGIIVAIYVIIHIINNALKSEQFDDSKEIASNSNNTFYKTNYSVITKYVEEEKTNDNNVSIIKEFINYCNEGRIDEAYSLLSADCKEVICPTIEDFTKGYYKDNFSQTKTYKFQLWINDDEKYTYRVELISDILATGGKASINKIDYYTVINDGENNYLNIDGFIVKNEIDIEAENDALKMKVKSEEFFMEYVNLNVEVQNKTQNEILLDKGTKGDSVYIIDEKNIAYASYLFEETDDNLVINKSQKKDFKIKFNKEYNKDISLKEIGFLDIIINFKKEEISKKLIIQLEK